MRSLILIASAAILATIIPLTSAEQRTTVVVDVSDPVVSDTKKVTGKVVSLGTNVLGVTEITVDPTPDMPNSGDECLLQTPKEYPSAWDRYFTTSKDSPNGAPQELEVTGDGGSSQGTPPTIKNVKYL